MQGIYALCISCEAAAQAVWEKIWVLIAFTCLACGKRAKRDSLKFDLKYCSNACQGRHRTDANYASWLAGERPHVKQNILRRYVLIRDGNICSSCHLVEWIGRVIPVEVHHLDGNGNNGRPENVVLLCPNCHALTSSFRGLNRGNGRASRRISASTLTLASTGALEEAA
jgi:5-methylcytosine-specific restriction endonuclease McrA